MANYRVNKGNRDYAVRLGCEEGVYNFLSDYARDMGISMSAAVRRLVLIGARCEGEHGQARMPASYASIRYDPSQIFDNDDDEKFDWSDD